VLRAVQEVEDALVSYAQEQVRGERLTAAVDAAQQAADLAAQRYNTGLRDFRDVLDAQRSLVSLQDQLAASRANVSTAVVQLYRALGGGWSVMPALPAP
jgi:outer membrane protein TolC